MKKCPRCKTFNDDERKWCKECGLKFGQEFEVLKSHSVTDTLKSFFLPKPINCPNCQKEISGTAITCDYCEHKLRVFGPKEAPTVSRAECPFCKTVGRIYSKNETTTGGKILFVVMILFLCWPLCWIGLMITERRTYCGACQMKIN
jgi:phage FluMu protein Com